MTQTDFATGLRLMAEGRFAEAARHLETARAATPTAPQIAHALGLALFKAGDLGDAESVLRAAHDLSPGDDDILDALALVQIKAGNWNAALSTLGRCAQTPDVLADQALALNELGRFAEAETMASKALETDACHADAYNALGLAFNGQNRLAEAEAVFRHMADNRLGVNNLGLNNLGNVLKRQGRTAEAEACYRDLLTHFPDAADIHFNLAHALLLGGNLRRGLAEYEWRLKNRAPGLPLREMAAPRWHAVEQGADWDGKTLLIHAEQGFGDTIQFARFLPRMIERGRVVVELPRSLTELLAPLTRGAVVVPKGEPLPPYDLHCPLVSLGHELGIGLDDLDGAPYLSADPAKTASWAERLPKKTGLRAGILWAGNPIHADDRNRSIDPTRLDALWRRPGISWVNLQKDGPSPCPCPGADPTAELADFSDTAAVLDNLDMVVTVDTAVAHLAGAMGVPCLVMLAYAPDWRWLLERKDSPWYRSLTLLRQPRPGDWASVIAEAAERLRDAAPR